MKEYKRFTKVKSTAENTKIVYNENGVALISKELVDMLLKYHNCLWEIENKIENGTLIELPCKVGDKVWTINCWQEYGDTSKGEPYYVTRYEMHENKCSYFEIHEKENYKGQIVIQPRERFMGVQPYVFLTKAEAEAKLKDLKEISMKKYQIHYEYNDKNGLFRIAQCCTVFNDYNKAENELSDILSELERQGCTNVAGDIIEL